MEEAEEDVTSLVVEVDEHDQTKRIYWVKNIDLTAEITSGDEKSSEEAPAEQAENSDNIFDITTPLKYQKEAMDDDNVPSSSEKVKREKKRYKFSTYPEGSELKITKVENSLKPKGGKHFKDEKGYDYYQHSTTQFKRQLKCVFANVAKFKCQAKASMALDPPDSPIFLSSKSEPHNHPPENERTLASVFAKRLKKRTLAEPNTSVKQIYLEESKMYPVNAKMLPENIALQRMRRCRRMYERAIKGEPKCSKPSFEDENPGPSTELEMYAAGKVIYVDSKGYQYHQQYSSVNKRQLRCVKARVLGERCPARASMPLQPRYAPIKITKTGHNHPPEDTKQTIFYYNLKKRAKFESKSLRAIYDEEAKKDPELALANPFSKVKQAMQRVRRISGEHITSQNTSIKSEDHTPVQKNQAVPSSSHQSGSPCRSTVRRRLDNSGGLVSQTLPAVTNERDISYRYALVSSDEPVCPLPSEINVRVVSNSEPLETTNETAINTTPRSVEDVYAHVEMQDIFIGPGQKMDTNILYECPSCKRLFDSEDPLDQHIVDEHVNSIMVEDDDWDDPDTV